MTADPRETPALAAVVGLNMTVGAAYGAIGGWWAVGSSVVASVVLVLIAKKVCR